MRFISMLLALTVAFSASAPARAEKPSVPVARYRIKTDTPASSGAHKEHRTLAERRRAEAETLRARWTVESILQAVKVYEDSARLWLAAGNLSEAARTFLSIGDSLTSISQHREALAPYDKALSLYKETGDRRGVVAARNGIGAVYAFLGRNEEAEKYCQGTLALGDINADVRLHAQALHNLGDVYYNLSRMSDALNYFKQALSLWRAAKEARGEAQTLTRVGYIHIGLSDMTQAAEAYNQALPLWRASGDKRGLALSLTALGNLYNKMEEKQRALDFYYEAMRIFQPMGDPYGEATTLAGIAYVYERSGDDEAALDHYKRALELYRKAGHRLGETVTLIVTGRIYNSIGDHRRALENLKLAHSVSQSLADPLVTSYVLGYLGEVYDSLGDKQQALAYYEQSLKLVRAGNDQRQEAYILNSIGVIQRSLGERDKAVRLFTDALALNQLAHDPGGQSTTLYNLARAALDKGDTGEAYRQVREALSISESLRAKVAGQELRASYFALVHKQFDLYINVLMRLHQQSPAERFNVTAFEASERGRARSLLETLAEGQRDIRQGVDAALLRREAELRRLLNAKGELRIHLAAAGKTSGEESAAVERELDALTSEYQQVQGRIRAASPRYASLTQPAPLTLEEIQQKVLDADTLLLEYALGEERSFVWTVTRDAIKSFELPPRAEIERASRRVYELLTARNRQPRGEAGALWQEHIARAEAEYEKAVAELGRVTVEPLAGELGTKRLVIVSEGALQYIPFEVLPEPYSPEAGADSSKPEAQVAESRPPLIVRHEILSLPSASVLALMREELQGRDPAPKSVAVIADPVFDRNDERLTWLRAEGRERDAGRPRARRGRPTVAAADVQRATVSGAQRALRDFDGLADGSGIARLSFSQREAKAIMATVPAGEGLLALGFKASRITATSAELSKYRIIHFATHGLLNSEHPELSGIVLSLYDESGKSQDGFLQLHEVYNLKLNADLVVLSACQTALGKEIRGEGLVGLTRGFMYAGAARVIASRWKVDDAGTAELMGNFYRAMLLGKGSKPVAALRAAQIQMLQQSRWRSPYYWAAFTLQGEWR